MYKVLIVDDEDLTREGLSNLVDWNSMGFEIVSTFEDGSDALTYLEDNLVDVVLTDIKMTFVSGIELAKHIYENKLPIKVILLSGYQEFELAREAVRYNVVNYMLKPIALKNIQDVFGEIKQKLDDEQRAIHISQQNKKRYGNILKFSQEKFLMDMVMGTYNNKDDIVEAIKLLGLKIAPDSSTCSIMSICIQNYSHIKDSWDYGKSGLMNAVSNFFNINDKKIVLYKVSSHQQKIYYMAIASEGEGQQFEDNINMHITNVCMNIKKILDLDVFIKVEKSFDSIFELAMTPTVACEPFNMLASEENDNNWNFIYNVERHKMLLTHIINKEPKLAINVLEHFMNEMEPYGIEVAKSVFGEFFTMLTKKMIENGIAVRLTKETVIIPGATIANMDDLRTWGLELIDNLINAIKSDKKGTENDVISRVKQYIKKHYNEDVTLEDAANHVFLSSVYLSRLFKEQTGENFSEYLVKIKLAKAVDILGQPQYKVYEVSEMIGYNSVKYFYRVFKRYYDCTPTEYRKRIMMDYSG